MLRDLANAFQHHTWRPQPWRQVPYPKKGARLRHYAMPTVRDQVAFMAHMVALGPILDNQMPNFAFGNRWYRPIPWNRRLDPPRWQHRPYPVLTNATFLSYARSHGLFRRVAHWTVARMTDAPLPAPDDSGRVQLPSDHGETTLPLWTRRDWWSGTADTSRAFWAALDIELAYPSVRLNRLAIAMDTALHHSPNDVALLFDGCPQPVLEALAVPAIRVEIGRRLTTALRQITLETAGIPPESWAPPQAHPLPSLSVQPYDGIPTGLAISGILLNVLFLEADRVVATYLQQTKEHYRAAFLRFADDMYVMSRSPEGLWSLIETVHRALSGTGSPSLATPNWDSNICISFKKIRPDPVREVIRKYLLHNGWHECQNEKCKQPLPPPRRDHATVGILKWWVATSTRDELAADRDALMRTAIDRGDVGPFVTTLVERLSDMGTDTLRQRFGEGARDHLVRLHELALFDIADEQVRADTRRAFAVNRLVRAWLPKARRAGEEHRELRQIRETLAFVLDRTPWKFSIWRAIVRAAARRPLSEPDGTDHEATAWLSNQLRRIACATDPTASASWLNAWPEIDTDDGHAPQRPDAWRAVYLSFLRAAFWRALAQVVRELRGHADRMAHERPDFRVPLPANWTTRAVAEPAHVPVAKSLARIDRWIDVLYPDPAAADVAAWPWELDELVAAVLAMHSTVELADAWRSARNPGTLLLVPATARLEEMPKARVLLSRFGRLRDTGRKRNRKLDYWALANVQLGHRDRQLGDMLFPTSGASRILATAADARPALAAGVALGCFEWMDATLARRALPSMEGGAIDALARDVFVLRDYGRARRVIVGQEAVPAARPTIHRLLWGRPTGTTLNQWPMTPWETPAVGLPSRVAAALFRVARAVAVPDGWASGRGPLNWCIDDSCGVLAAGRHGQFRPAEAEPEPTVQPLRMERTVVWEVMPHAAFYLPFVSAQSGPVHDDSYVLYCDALLLLTALDGDERILDGLAQSGVRGTPFVDRWSWRSRIHLPLAAWRSIEEILRWNEAPAADVMGVGDQLVESLTDWSDGVVSTEDFLPERIDVGLSGSPDLEIVRTIRPAGGVGKPDLPPELGVPDTVSEELVVRVGQVAEWPTQQDVVARFPHIATPTANAMLEQVCDVFLAPAQRSENTRPRVVVLPELAIPQQEIRSLRDLVRNEGRAAVAGLYWRALQPVFRPPRRLTPTRRFFVNEAELIVPIGEDRGPPTVRWFRVRKPVPAHIEDGLAAALSIRPPRTKWRMLAGRRWYRFVHADWGDFSIAICADLIDSAPWRSLRGELLHLLMVAFNKDVELFDSLTWVRAYENYMNVASVNHGRYGGSFLWTPRHTQGRELARLRGSGLVLTADVRLPVRELLRAQRDGARRAIRRAAKGWQGMRSPRTQFKAPPPGFRRREE
ncbi:MAG: hypothetical protein OXU81_12390 [Gammaproteobacteria bacterium]|nr:hypothetical protein [Gammaproteobacteria bacterium]